jgi:hypothetical protein
VSVTNKEDEMSKIQVELDLLNEIYASLSRPEDYPVRKFYELAMKIRHEIQHALNDTPNVSKDINVKIDIDAESAIATLKRLQDHLVDTIELTNELKGSFK